MPSVDIYARISEDRRGDRAGVDRRQLPDCREFAQHQALVVDEEHVDNDLTAYKAKPRPAYQRLYGRIKDGLVTQVVVWHLDRLYRNTKELEELIDLVEATNVRILTVSGGDFDLNTSDGRAYARIVVALAQKESEDKVRRIRRKHQQLAEEGKAVGGGRPFGYEKDRVTVRPAEAELVREAARRILAGESTRSVCMDWNTRGITTTHGRPWTLQRMRLVMTSWRIAGIRSLADTPVTKAEWPALVDEITHRRLRAVLLDPGRRVNAGARTHLLTGFLFCGRDGCGARMIARRGRNRARTYVCAVRPGEAGCGGLRVVAQPLEDEIRDRIFARLADSDLDELVTAEEDDAEEEALLDAMAADQAALDQLSLDHYVARPPLIGRDQFLAASRALEARLDATKRALGLRERRVTASALTTGDGPLPGRWEAMTLSQKRAVIESVLERITIMPAQRGATAFDPERAKVLWRPKK